MSNITVASIPTAAIAPLESVNGNFDAFAEINGKLNVLNTASLDRNIRSRHVQLRAVSGGKMVGGTASLDYFNGVRYFFARLYPSSDSTQTMELWDHGYLDSYGLGITGVTSAWGGVTDAPNAPEKRCKALPRGSTSFDLPFRATVVVTWQITWTSDAARLGATPLKKAGAQKGSPNKSEFPQPGTAVRFFVDGAEHANASTTRETREAMFGAVVDASETEIIPKHALRDRSKSRYWSGHAVVTLAKGSHTASLRVAMTETVRQMRVRARNIKVVYFRAEG